MICCVAIASVVALAVRLWRLVTLQSMRKASAFPPVARRPAPSYVIAAAQKHIQIDQNYKYTTSKLLMFYAACIAFYCAVIEFLIFGDILQIDNGNIEWGYRNTFAIGAIIYFVLMSVFPSRKKQKLHKNQFWGSMATILGIVFTLLSILDFHMFQFLQFQSISHLHHHNHEQMFFTSEYLALHGVALMPILVGQILLCRDNANTQTSMLNKGN